MSWNFISLLSILLNLCSIIYASSPAAEVEIEQSVPSSLTFHIEGGQYSDALSHFHAAVGKLELSKKNNKLY